VQALTSRPPIKVVNARPRRRLCLGRGAGPAGAAQVADRWHLMENASHAPLATAGLCMRLIRAALGMVTVDPRLLTAAEKLRYEGYLRREDDNAAVMALHKGESPSRKSSDVPAIAEERCVSWPSGQRAVAGRSRSTSKH
jgi:hypothetical protein